MPLEKASSIAWGTAGVLLALPTLVVAPFVG